MSTINWLRAACAAGTVLATGCVAAPEPTDLRVALESCEHGLYWAECGGTEAPVLGCDRETGDCRWFGGGVTARGYAVSDCPTTDTCCHDNWPFTDFAPSGATLNRARDQLSILGHTVTARHGASDVHVTVDRVDPPVSATIRCEVEQAFPGCRALASGATLQQIGGAVVVTFNRGSFRVELEIAMDDTLDGWSANLYYVREFSPRDGPPQLWCENYSVGEEVAVTGEGTRSHLPDQLARRGRSA